MAGGFSIKAFLDPSRWLRGARDMEESIEDLEGALEDASDEVKQLDKQGDRAFDAVEDGAEDAGKDVSKLEKRLREVRDESKKVERSGEDIGDGYKKGMKRAEEGLGEFKDESNSTAREAAASFDGSAESIADAFQEVAANAFAGFGPAGAAAGIAAAAGIGLVLNEFTKIQEAQEAAEESAAEWADKFIESGQRAATAAQQTAAVLEIYTDPEKYKQAAEAAELWGVDTETAVLAISGNAPAMQVVEDSLRNLGIAAQEQRVEAQKVAEANGSVLLGLTPLEQKLDSGTRVWEAYTGAQVEGARRADEVSNSLLRILDNASEAEVQIDEVGNAVYTLPDGTQIFIDAKTGQATLNVDRFKGDLNSIPKSKTVTVNGTVDMSQVTRGIRNYRPPTIHVQVRTTDRFGKQLF